MTVLALLLFALLLSVWGGRPSTPPPLRLVTPPEPAGEPSTPEPIEEPPAVLPMPQPAEALPLKPRPPAALSLKPLKNLPPGAYQVHCCNVAAQWPTDAQPPEIVAGTVEAFELAVQRSRAARWFPRWLLEQTQKRGGRT